MGQKDGQRTRNSGLQPTLPARSRRPIPRCVLTRAAGALGLCLGWKNQQGINSELWHKQRD